MKMKKSCEDWLNEQFAGDVETIQAVYAEYVTSAVELGQRLSAARAGGDREEIERLLHTLKGTAGLAGDSSLSAKAQGARATQDSALLDEIEREISELQGE